MRIRVSSRWLIGTEIEFWRASLINVRKTLKFAEPGTAGAGRFRTCAGAGPHSLVWRRAGTCLPAMARHEALRGVPVQVGNRAAAPWPVSNSAIFTRPDLPLSGRADGGDLREGWVARPAARQGRVGPMSAALGPHTQLGRTCGPS